MDLAGGSLSGGRKTACRRARVVLASLKGRNLLRARRKSKRSRVVYRVEKNPTQKDMQAQTSKQSRDSCRLMEMMSWEQIWSRVQLHRC